MIETLNQLAYGESEFAAGWALFPRVDQMLRYLQLQAEKRRRAGIAARIERSSELRLLGLMLERWCQLYFADRDRQHRVAEVLGIEWPPEPHHSIRPFVWCWEELPPTFDRALAYPHDWRRDEYPDLYGFGDEWRAGEPLVIPVDDVPVDAELVESVRARRPRPTPRVDAPGLGSGIEDAEVIDEAPPRPREIAPPVVESFVGEAAMLAAMEAAPVTPGLEGLAALARQSAAAKRDRHRRRR